ncbi:hypothetical protein Q9189_007744 [Teloschistes chrysophthalmus]
MLAKANRNKEITKADNVSFNESPITQISLPDATAHCIISNCVINLVPETEKQLVFNEMYRLLKPGGRVAISDILVKRPLPEELKNNVALYVGCISGASLVQDYEKYLKDAGFSDTLIVDTKNDLNVYKTANPELGRTGCCVGPSESGCGSKKPKAEPTKDARKHPLDNSSESLDFNEWAGSCKIFALKPQTS